MIGLDDQFKSTFPELTAVVIVMWIAGAIIGGLIWYLYKREGKDGTQDNR